MECLLAVLVLAACLAPALQSIANNNHAQGQIWTTQREISCVKQALETTMAEPYSALSGAAVSTYTGSGFSNPVAAYSSPATADPECPFDRKVYVLPYNPSDQFATNDKGMLYVRAEIPGSVWQATLAIKP